MGSRSGSRRAAACSCARCRCECPGPYQLQAAIAAVHSEAAERERDGLAADRRAVRRARACVPLTGGRAEPRGRVSRSPQGPVEALELVERSRGSTTTTCCTRPAANLLGRLGARRRGARGLRACARARLERGRACVPRRACRPLCNGTESELFSPLTTIPCGRYHVRHARSSPLRHRGAGRRRSRGNDARPAAGAGVSGTALSRSSIDDLSGLACSSGGGRGDDRGLDRRRTAT